LAPQERRKGSDARSAAAVVVVVVVGLIVIISINIFSPIFLAGNDNENDTAADANRRFFLRADI